MAKSDRNVLLYIIAVWWICQWCGTLANEFHIGSEPESVLGCTYNNTKYANGSFVLTTEPCLNCKCINANLICALRVCPEQPFPPPRGCVIVQKRDSCCPYMTCSKFQPFPKDQEKRPDVTHDAKWIEYNLRNRLLFNQNAVQRRIEDTDDDGNQFANGKMCIHNGTVYRSGSAMTTSSLCSYCYCIEGIQKCVQPKCTLPPSDCEPISIDSSCCPIRYDCTANKTIKAKYNAKFKRRRIENTNKHYLRMTSRMQRSRGCLVNSNFYPEGHRLPRNETNPCEICFCIGGSKRCTPKKCAPMIRNCRPIVPEGQCCPSSYDCNYKPKVPTARGFTPRQYDFFSLFFGDENKDNQTTSWDYEAETESMATDLESSSPGGKDIFDAIKDSLNDVDANKEKTQENQTYLLESSTQSTSSFPYLDNDDEEEEDDEDISILDYLLNGDKVLSSTTPQSIGFNVTGKPLANGATNSPMHIEPVLPAEIKNESVKFAMLPMSLYNMINDDGSVIFEKSTSTENVKPSEATERIIQITEPSTTTKQPVKVTILKEPTTQKKEATIATTTTTTRKPETSTTTTTSLKPMVSFTTSKVASVVRPSTIETIRIKSTASTILSSKTTESTTQKPIITINKLVTAAKTTKAPGKISTTPVPASTTDKITKKSPPSTTQETSPKTTTTTNATPTIPKLVTKKKSSVKNSTSVHQVLTTKTTRIPPTTPKIIAIPLNSNPSIPESDVTYDYSDPTLPPSLPNLKIIPFLPTDAVRNSIHKNEQYEHGYYVPASVSHQPQHIPLESHADTNYSPFNGKPDREHLPYYSGGAADDRIDYDSYKPAENVAHLDYGNIYSGGGAGNVPHPLATINVDVNSKLDYEHNPSKLPVATSTGNRNLTVKPPLPPFEPEHLYNNIPPQIQLHTDNEYVQYHVNGGDEANESPIYHSEHNYQIPQFVTIPPKKEPSRPVSQSAFGHKNKFTPPAKTEGGFVPKRPITENYIPLRGTNYFEENLDSNVVKVPNSSAPSHDVNEKNAKPVDFDYTALLTQKIENPAEMDIEGIRPDVHLTHMPGLHLGDIFEIPAIQNDTKLHTNDIFAPQREIPGAPSSTTPKSTTNTIIPKTSLQKSPSKTTKPPGGTNPTIPLKLITILNNTKKESPTKIEPPQRKNNKIIDPNDEPLDEVFVTPAMPSTASVEQENDESLTALREAFLSSLSLNTDISDQVLHTSQIFSQRPVEQLSPSYAGSSHFPANIEPKHKYQSNPIRSELYLIVPEVNKNKETDDLSHTNNYSSEINNYQVLPNDDSYLTNTEADMVNPIDVDKMKESETKIFTPPHNDPMGILKLSGCNIYGRMYRVGRIITELSSSCLECRCTEVGVSCTPLAC